jgi:hypothetical protein
VDRWTANVESRSIRYELRRYNRHSHDHELRLVNRPLSTITELGE